MNVRFRGYGGHRLADEAIGPGEHCWGFAQHALQA